jgi:hypothetical protein
LTAELKVLQNAWKLVSAKAFGNNNTVKIPANQVCPRIARIDPNDFRADERLFTSSETDRFFVY